MACQRVKVIAIRWKMLDHAQICPSKALQNDLLAFLARLSPDGGIRLEAKLMWLSTPTPTCCSACRRRPSRR
jgi:hypothetical protein